MKTIMIVALASVVLGVLAVPFVTAEQECGRADLPDAVINHPTAAGRYLYLNPANHAKLGEWQEVNRREGLQTMDCFQFGVRQFYPDFQVSKVLPS